MTPRWPESIYRQLASSQALPAVLEDQVDTIPAAQKILPPQDTMHLLLDTFGREADNKNRQLDRLFDALGMSLAQTRANYERELQTLHQQLDGMRADRAAEQKIFEARVDTSLRDIRDERDHLRARVRELEEARDNLSAILVPHTRRGLIARIFRR